MLRLKLQPSIPQRESSQEEAIIGGDIRPRALVMDSSGFARLLEVPINEPVRGTPWNHQKACAATLSEPHPGSAGVEAHRLNPFTRHLP
ncbi:hypothetical protein [Myxococcus xanthus]|uniref:hypothetical protein n=1 Tax=Myxococcus xanthus TaxID=34 RepID=UPI00112BCC9E|nr:hypothetical protein [Myxococcus xanthus]